jgi:hypothetical protein
MVVTGSAYHPVLVEVHHPTRNVARKREPNVPRQRDGEVAQHRLERSTHELSDEKSSVVVADSRAVKREQVRVADRSRQLDL